MCRCTYSVDRLSMADYWCFFQVNVSLNETETIWHLELPSSWVAAGDDEQEELLKKNNQYEEVCPPKEAYVLTVFILLCIFKAL